MSTYVIKKKRVKKKKGGVAEGLNTPQKIQQCFSTFFEPWHHFHIEKIPGHTNNQKYYKTTHKSWMLVL